MATHLKFGKWSVRPFKSKVKAVSFGKKLVRSHGYKPSNVRFQQKAGIYYILGKKR